jgi:hypothetical protein
MFPLPQSFSAGHARRPLYGSPCESMMLEAIVRYPYRGLQLILTHDKHHGLRYHGARTSYVLTRGISQVAPSMAGMRPLHTLRFAGDKGLFT